jgi:hypothetical protein
MVSLGGAQAAAGPGSRPPEARPPQADVDWKTSPAGDGASQDLNHIIFQAKTERQ